MHSFNFPSVLLPASMSSSLDSLSRHFSVLFPAVSFGGLVTRRVDDATKRAAYVHYRHRRDSFSHWSNHSYSLVFICTPLHLHLCLAGPFHPSSADVPRLPLFIFTAVTAVLFAVERACRSCRGRRCAVSTESDGAVGGHHWESSFFSFIRWGRPLKMTRTAEKSWCGGQLATERTSMGIRTSTLVESKTRTEKK